MQEAFQLHPRLEADSLPVARLALCDLRLVNDSRFAWLILVPRRPGISEVHQLPEAEQASLLRESSRVAGLLLALAGADKINIGALGNLVPQLHWHLVARRREDPCWPGPVWGCGSAVPYTEEAADALCKQLQERLSD
jgi:diadenosine tetraphosphate (Ap4A) HIT family hydrolase